MFDFIKNLFTKSTDIRQVVFDQDQNSGCGCRDSWAMGTAGYGYINPLETYRYYASVEPLGESIDKISSAACNLPLSIKYEGTDEYIMVHDILSRIENPGDEMQKNILLKELIMSSLLTNEAWLILRGNVTRPPVGLSYVRPYDVEIQSHYDSDGCPVSIRTASPRDKRAYYKENVNGEIRYFDKRKMNELCPIIGVVELLNQFRGLSPLTSIKEELEQIRGGNAHNSSFLKSGMRPSHAIQADAGEIKHTGRPYPGGKQMDDFSKSIQQGFQGAGNAGKVLTLPFPAKIDDLSTSNKDADYIQLISKAEKRIYNRYGIPLAIVLENAMTLDNYTTSLISFYDNAVFEGTADFFSGLSSCLRTRFNESDILKITFNPHQVKALQERAADRMKKLRETQSLSTDEIRATAGYKPVDKGGDILVGGSLIPLSEISLPTFEGAPDDE